DSGWVSTITEGTAGLLVTEVRTGGGTCFVELQNVSDEAIDTTGWTVVANDATSGNASDVLATGWDLPASVPGGDVLYRTDDPADAGHYWGEAIPWDVEGPGWVMVLDDAGQVMDYVAWGYTEGEIDALAFDFGALTGITVGEAWTGPGAQAGSATGVPSAGFVTYNDHIAGPGTHASTTTYAAIGTASGFLKDIDTGADTSVTLTVSDSGGLSYQNYQAYPAPGTDAYDVFNGYVDLGAADDASIELRASSSQSLTHTFSDLDTGDVVTYDFTGTAIRGGGYRDRWTLVSLNGADFDALVRAHSAGLGIVTDGLAKNQVALWTGENDWADQGFVVGWSGIDPGPDGRFTVVSTQYTGAIPVEVDPGGVADGDKGYGLSGIRLEEIAPSGPTYWLERSGHTDNDGAGDFARDDDGSQGTQNAGMTVPFGTEYAAAMAVGFSDGHYDGLVQADLGGAMQGVNASLWTRLDFTAPDLAGYDALTLRVRYDDGFIAYLDGEVVAAQNDPATPAWNSAATGEHPNGQAVLWEAFDLTDHLASLAAGDHVLALVGLNVDAADADFLLQAELFASAGDPNASVNLNPGLNRVTAEAWDAPGGVGSLLDTATVDVWYDTGTTTDYPQAQGAAGTTGTGEGDTGPAPTTGLSELGLELDMTVRDSYLPAAPVLVRVQIVNSTDGTVYRDLWDATATLASDNPAVTLSDDTVTLYNGLGSALVTFTGSGDFNLTATVDDLQEAAGLTDWSAQPVTEVSGSLASSETWSGIVHVTGGDYTIPDGVTLTLDPGTLVLVDGVASGTGGTDIDVAGAIQSLGTAASPVTITAQAAGENWGELDFQDAEPSTFQYTSILQAGHSPHAGHSNSGPAIRASGSTLLFDHANLTDHAGKVMHTTSGNDLTLTDSLMARSIMGPEIAGTALLMEDTWLLDMHAADDADGIYIHSQGTGQTCTITGGAAAAIDDDAIDTYGSEVAIQDVIVRDTNDKGISVYNGEVTITFCLVVDTNKAPEDPTVAGIAAKATGGSTTIVNIDHT
ncbi:MAG: hypothetical protein U9R68_03955, partial [Planctomycetota bacterium]|nr:hypothetical protein [Planctomycetota bacterium]